MNKRSPGGCSSMLLLLLVVFLALKLAGAVDWSWWWVTAPVWLPLAVFVAALAVMALMGVGVYKVVSAVLRREGFAAASRRPQDAKDGILEVEGTEITGSARDDHAQRSLPAPDIDAPSDRDAG